MAKIYEQIGNMLELQIEEGEVRLTTKQEEIFEKGSPIHKREPLFKLRMVFKEKDHVGQVITETLTIEQAKILSSKIGDAISDFENQVEKITSKSRG